jgi:hypothetical protein
MICPQCGSEFRDGFARCNDCEVPLVEPMPVEPDLELVRVYDGGNAALLPLVESILRDADIEFMTKGESLQDLFAFGRLGTGANNLVGAVEFWVRADDEERARALLTGVDESVAIDDETDAAP